MKHILVANPKGGCGKTTLATNLAGYFSSRGRRVIISDLDRQQSAAQWVARRPVKLPLIHVMGSEGNSPIYQPEWRITDSPAGLRDEKLSTIVKLADLILVPVQPSAFDIGATRDFLEILAAEKSVRKQKTFVAMVGMRVDQRTRSAQHLTDFLKQAGFPVLTYLRDAQVYALSAGPVCLIYDHRLSPVISLSGHHYFIGLSIMPSEIELKLRISPRDVAQLKQHPLITLHATSPGITRKLVSTYFDTNDLALLDKGLSLRVRRMAGSWFQAVKNAGTVNSGLHQRMEWEDIIASGNPDFTRILDPDLIAVFSDVQLREALKPIFRTDVMRSEWLLHLGENCQIELALDRGWLIAGQKKESISEIELELKQGHPAELFKLAMQLQKSIPLQIENISKAQRGYAHYRPNQPNIVKARLPQLHQESSANQAFRQIVRECLNHLQGNHDMVLNGGDIEGVHQMRVALRRLRSAFSIFTAKPSVETTREESTHSLVDDIRWISSILGKARDLDVFIEETLPPITTQLNFAEGLVAFRNIAITEQRKAYIEVRQALNARRYQQFLIRISAWLEDDSEHINRESEQQLLTHAANLLEKRFRKIKRYGKNLRSISNEERHEFRIACKKLRYAAEFFISLYPTKNANQFMASLASLQQILGSLNDIAVTESIVKSLAGSKSNRSLQDSMLLLTGWHGHQIKHQFDLMDHMWHRLLKQKCFWK